MSKADNSLVYRYKFSFENGSAREFVITLDYKTLRCTDSPVQNPPEWARLQHNQCPNCPLNERTHPHCPIALNLVEVVNFFKDLVSYEKTYMSIESGSRTYIGKVPLQEAIKSLVGIYMVTSGCPVLDPLRPGMRIHIPFPDMDESMYRLISMYLLSQYFIYKAGGRPDWELKNLLSMCNDIQTVNRSFFRRLRALKLKDASLNALVALDSIAAYTASFLEDGSLGDLKKLFNVNLDQAGKEK
jgi:hypothetical protein